MSTTITSTTGAGRISPAARGVLYVHSSPRALCPHVEWAVSSALGEGVSFRWEPQPTLRGGMRTAFSWEGGIGTGATIATALRGWDEQLRYEITQDPTEWTDGSRWMHTPQLGIFYAQTDSVGNVVIGEDRLRAAMENAGLNALELHRELRLALGQAWDDELEPFRSASTGAAVIWLHDSVG